MEDKNLGKALSMEISPISQAMMFQGLGAASLSAICYIISDSRIWDKIALGIRIIASSTGFILLTSRQHIAMVAGLIAIVLLYRKPVKAFIFLLMSYCLLVIMGFMRYTEVYREKVAGHYLFFADFFGQLRFFPDLYEVFKNSPKLTGKTYVGALSSIFPSEFFSLFGLNKEDYYLIAGRYAKDLLGLKFSGGGIGISALGELYINFGMPGIFFGFSVLTLIILFVSKKLLKNRENPEYFVLYILNILFLTLFLLLSSTVILPQYIFVVLPLYLATSTLRKSAKIRMIGEK
jgi:oligosaccharide repeat unit polymerase